MRPQRLLALILIVFAAVALPACAEGEALREDADRLAREVERGLTDLLGRQPEPTTTGPNVVAVDVLRDPSGSVLVFAPVFIEGEGPFTFIIDTGASQSVVEEQLATDLGLPEVGWSLPVVGLTGATEATLVAVDDWQVGDVPLPAGRAARLQLPSISSDSPMRRFLGLDDGGDLRGLLGSDVLSRFDSVTIDYEQELLTLGRAE